VTPRPGTAGGPSNRSSPPERFVPAECLAGDTRRDFRGLCVDSGGALVGGSGVAAASNLTCPRRQPCPLAPTVSAARPRHSGRRSCSPSWPPPPAQPRVTNRTRPRGRPGSRSTSTPATSSPRAPRPPTPASARRATPSRSPTALRSTPTSARHPACRCPRRPCSPPVSRSTGCPRPRPRPSRSPTSPTTRSPRGTRTPTGPTWARASASSAVASPPGVGQAVPVCRCR